MFPVTLLSEKRGLLNSFKKTDIVPSFGFALFLTINATQVWGGVFPFLPMSFQTESVTLGFYLAQSIAFVAAFAAGALEAYWFPQAARKMNVAIATTLVAVGSVLVIAAMYSSEFTLVLVYSGGVLLGIGTAAFFMLWQRYFSSIDARDCNMQLMLGTALSAPIYFALHAVPIALTAFLVPAVLLPISALCLSLAVRTMVFEQAMFEDIPRDNPSVYSQLLRDSWRSAVCVAALGLACGLARGVALRDPSVGAVVNVCAMLGSLSAAIILLWLSRTKSVSFDMNTTFRIVFPFVVTGMLLFPLFRGMGIYLFSGMTYMALSIIVLVMMMICAQVSRDRGTSPVFVYGFFAACAYAPQGAGFLLGWNAEGDTVLGVEQTAFFAVVAMYVLGIALLLVSIPRSDLHRSRSLQVELIKPARTRAEATPDAADAPKAGSAKKRRGPRRQDDDGVEYKDRTSKQVAVAKDAYALSTREAEVMNLLARGHTVSSIAESLFISENTVRTHSKHIYAKMDVHSKFELMERLEQVDLSALDA